MIGGDPVLNAITASALDVTSARAAWLISASGAGFVVVAIGGEAGPELLGTALDPHLGSVGYVVESGQPLALGTGRMEDRMLSGLATSLGRSPTSLLCVPCESEGRVNGALELIDKVGAPTFSFDDVELVSVLANIAGVALGAGRRDRDAVPTPGRLQASLEALAHSEPAAYVAVTDLVAALLNDD